MMQNDRNFWAGLTLALATLPSIAGCQVAPERTQAPEPAISRVIDRGEGVYQFPVQDWPQSLVEFKQAYPEKRITAMFAGERFGGGNGMSNDSVIVVTEAR